MLSIVIPTLNEERWLPGLLGSIESQHYRDYEIIVADAGSSDSTVSIARQYGCRLVAGGTPAIGRNNGARAAEGDYLLFLDADVLLPHGFLGSIVREATEYMADVAVCLVRPLSKKRLDFVLHQVANCYICFAQRLDPHAPGFCILARRNLHDRIGGFNENLRLAEDHDYAKRAARAGRYKVLRSQHIMVSVRRLQKEGRLRLSMKYVFVEIYRLVKGEIYTEVVEYDLGRQRFGLGTGAWAEEHETRAIASVKVGGDRTGP